MSGIRWGVACWGWAWGGGVPFLSIIIRLLTLACRCQLIFYILFVSSLSVDDRVRKVRNEARDYAAWLRGEAGTFFNHQSTTTRALYACVGPAYID